MRILILEDDKLLAQFVQEGLEVEQHAADVVHDGNEGLRMLENGNYDLLVLDLGLPGIVGEELLRRLRIQNQTLPVLVLTAQNRVEERVKALDLGADDYMIKPFSFVELTARVRALLRRGHSRLVQVLRVNDLELDRLGRTVNQRGEGVHLTEKEFALLEYLMLNAGRRVTRAMIISHVWKLSSDTMTNVVDVYVNYLRKKLEKDKHSRLIHTVRGVGYQLGDAPGAG